MGAARGVGGDGLAEERGGDDTDESDVVGVIQDVERIDGDSEGGDVFLFVGFRFEGEVVRHVEIEIDEAGAVESVARTTEGTIVYDAVAVVVRAGGDVYWLSGIKRESRAENEQIREMR